MKMTQSCSINAQFDQIQKIRSTCKGVNNTINLSSTIIYILTVSPIKRQNDRQNQHKVKSSFIVNVALDICMIRSMVN